MNITISSLGRSSSAAITAAQPCSYGRFIITASQLLPLLPPPHPSSSCILPPLPPLPLLFSLSLHPLQPHSLPPPAPLPPFALGHTSHILTVSPLFPCLFNRHLPPPDKAALSLSLPPPLLDLIARHAVQRARLVVLLMGFDDEHTASISPAAFNAATAVVNYTFVLSAASSSEVDAVIAHCSYAHLHLLPQWQTMQLHATIATIGTCSAPFPSVLHIPHTAPSSSLHSIASALQHPFTPPPFSPASSTSRVRIAALAYTACNASAAAASYSGGGENNAALAHTIACLERQLIESTKELQLQCATSPLSSFLKHVTLSACTIALLSIWIGVATVGLTRFCASSPPAYPALACPLQMAQSTTRRHCCRQENRL